MEEKHGSYYYQSKCTDCDKGHSLDPPIKAYKVNAEQVLSTYCL